MIYSCRTENYMRKGKDFKHGHSAYNNRGCRCGVVKVQAHHEDYTKPLEVTWLCSACHAKVHKLSRKV